MGTAIPIEAGRADAVLKAALEYARRGWQVFPCYGTNEQNECLCDKGRLCDNTGKHPITKQGFKDATTDEKQIKAWFGPPPFGQTNRRNVAIATGAVSGIVVLDVDPKYDGETSLKQLEARYGKAKTPLTTITGGGGRHLLFQHPGGVVQNSIGTVGKGLDIRGDGGYIVAAPSRHKSGQYYRWTCDLSRTKAAPFPAWLRSVAAKKAKPIKSTGGKRGKIPEGQRDVTLFRLAAGLRAKGLSEGAIKAALLEHNREHCDPPLNDKQVAKIARSAGAYPDGTDPELVEQFVAEIPEDKADLANCARFVAAHGKNLRYSKALGWLIWNGQRWALDITDQVVELGKATVRGILAEASKASGPKVEELLKLHAASCKRERINAMIGLAQSELAITPDKLDTDPFALNVLNGTIDLRTGKLKKHDPKDWITKIVPLVYNPRAKAPRFKRFIKEIFKDPTMPGFIRRIAGYSLTGMTNEQCFFVLHGDGANGKGTLVNQCLLRIAGDYGTTMRPDLLMYKHNGGGDNATLGAMARLKGARLIVTAETDERQKFDEAVIKNMTGEDEVVGKFLYHNEFRFRLEGKVWFSTNHQPEVVGDDHGIWRRIKLLPFTEKFYDPNDPRYRNLFKKNPKLPRSDTMLKETLHGETEGILAWAVGGAVQWWNRGKPNLRIPLSVAKATDQYRSDTDLIGQFINEECDTKDEKIKTPLAGLYRRYVAWSLAGGRHPLSKTRFGKRLNNAGYKKGHDVRRTVHFGLALRPPEIGPQEEARRKAKS